MKNVNYSVGTSGPRKHEFITPPDRGAESSVSFCLFVYVCLSTIISSELHVQFLPIFMHITDGRGSVLLWQRSDMLHISGFMDDAIFAHKPRLLDVAARLRQWGSHAALGLARRNTCCRQWTLGNTSCSQVLLGRSGCVEYLWATVNIYNIIFPDNVPAYRATRKWRVLKVTPHVATLRPMTASWTFCKLASCNRKRKASVL